MAHKRPRKPRLDDPLPNDPDRLLTSEVLREEFLRECSAPDVRRLVAGYPLDVLRDPGASTRDKLSAWERVVNRIGLTEKQQVEHSGSVALSAVGTLDVFVHAPEEPAQ